VTLQEINTPEDIWKKYIKKPYPGKSA